MRPLLLLGLVALAGCEQNLGAPDAGAPDAGHPISAALLGCASEPGNPLTSIAGVVGRVNALPHPVGGPCFVASLARPLAVVATTGTITPQPAGGPHDPRIFIMAPGVVIAVVSAGPGAKAIEMGEWVSATQTLKGEIALPVTQPLPTDDPLTRLETDGGVGTACGMCHRYEAPHGSSAHGYVSAAFRPKPPTDVKLEALAAEHQACITSGEVSERCDMFHALFDFGAITPGAFAKEVEYFIQ